MAGPSIAKAEVTVDLDGKRIPAEAKALGEEAGRAMGEAHNEAFGSEVEKGYGDLREGTIEDLKRTGDLAGDGSGKTFSEAFRGVVTREAYKLNHELADIFGTNDGLDRFYANAQKTVDPFRDIDNLVEEISSKLITAGDNGSLNAFQISQLAAETESWAEGAREVLREQQAIQKISLDRLLDDVEKIALRNKEAAAEADLMRKAFADVNESRLNNVLDDIANTRNEAERTREQIRGVGDDVEDLRKEHLKGLANDLEDVFESHGNLEGYRQSLQRLSGDFVSVDEVIDIANGRLDAYDKAAGGSGEVTDHFRGRLREFREEAKGGIVNELGNLIGKVDDLGVSFDRNGKKTDGFRDKLKDMFGSISKFDPADNMGQLFLIILAFAGPAAALISALGAQIVILGTALVGAGVGIAAFIIAFQGITGDISKLPAQVRPAAQAFQDLKKPLLDLQDRLQIAVFRDLATPFENLGAALPKLGPGVDAIGKALGNFLDKLTTGITDNIGPINSLLEGFAPIISSLGSAVVNLTGIFGGLFKAAMPFAQDVAKTIEATTKKFSDFVNSVEGQNQLKKWFEDAQSVISDVNGLLGDAGTAFSELITEQTKADLHTILESFGSLIISLGKIGASLSPAVTAVISLASKIGELVADLSPIVNGIGVLAEGIVAVVNPIIGFLTEVFKPIFETIGKEFETVGNALKAIAPAWEGFWGGASKIVTPVVEAIAKVYDKILDLVNQAIKIAQPAIDAFGQTFEDLGDAVGLFLDSLFDAAGDTDAFKGTAKGASDFLEGPFKTAVDNAKGFFKKFSDFIKTELIPTIKEIDWKLVTKGLDSIASIIPTVISAIGTIATALAADIVAWGAWVKFILDATKDVNEVVHAVSKVVSDVLKGDFGAAAVDGAKALKLVQDAGGDLKTNLSDAMSKTKTAIDTTNDAQKKLGQDGKDVSDKLKTAFNDFAKAGAGNLTDITKQLGYTGKDAVTFRDAVVDAAKKSGVSLADVAKATSLPDLEKRLGITGTAAQTQFEKKISAAAQDSGAAIDKLPPKVQAVSSKLNELNGITAKPKIEVQGENAALTAAASVKAKLQELNLSTATVTIITKQVASGTAAVGGVMAGGQLLAGGITAMAGGGIVSAPTRFGNVLTGESGLEAIVPLTRPLSQVDPSVRALSEFAQGMGAENKTKGGAYFAPGSVVVSSPSENPEIVASQVVDRMATQF